MKKIGSLILALILVFALTACGGSSSNNPPAANTPAANAPAADAPAANTPAANAPAANAPASPEPAVTTTAWNPDNIGNHTFILAHGMPETSQVGMQYNEFAVAAEELSGGKIKVEQRINATLVTDAQTLDALMDGTIDFCHSFASYVVGTITDLAPLSIAGFYGGDDWPGFTTECHDIISSIYADFGIKYLQPVFNGYSAFVCTDRQIVKPSDFSGMSTRVSGIWVAKTVETWGGAPTTIDLGDLADAFSKKTVQAMPNGLNIIVPYKIYESTQYVTFTSIAEGFGGLLMNGDTWASLNADEQMLIEEAAKVFKANAYAISVENLAGYEKTIEDEGRNTVYRLTPAEQQEFVSQALTLYTEMEQEVGPKGIDLINILKSINGVS